MREPLSRTDFMQRVLEENTVIRARLAAFHVARSLYVAEGGIYEPALVGTSDWMDRRRPNTIQLERSLRAGGIFIERNLEHFAGVEANTLLGGKVRVGGSARKLRNNLQRQVLVDLDAEYESTVDIFLEQPLLRGAGYGMAMAPRRLAAQGAEAAYQEYRRTLMETVGRAEIAYWELAFAQQQLRYVQGSVRTARFLVEDSRARFETGRGAELDVLEAQAGLALREARASTAGQRLVEAVNRLASFFGGRPEADGIQYQATESPEIRSLWSSYETGTFAAQGLNPELLRARHLVRQEELRAGIARNQRLPQVNLRGALGLAGLGHNWRSAYGDVERGAFPHWVVGVEVRVPLFTGIRERNEHNAAKQRLMQAEYHLREIEGQVHTELAAAIRKVDASEVTARSNAAAVDFRERLLRDRLSAHQAGRVGTRAVLEAEEDLMEARLLLLDSEVEHERALLELQLLQGDLLERRGIDLAMREIEEQVRGWARGTQLPPDLLRYRDPASSPEILAGTPESQP